MPSFSRSKLRILLVPFFFLLTTPLFAFTSLSEQMLANDTQEEIEPAIIGQVRFGVEYDVSVYMRFDPDLARATSKLYYSAWTSTGLSVLANPIPTVTGAYATYADPVLVQNPSTNRIYLVALGTDAGNGSAVLSWYSDNGGWAWSGPTTIASVTPGYGNGTLDKPSATVAPDGTLYVSWLEDNQYTNLRTITIANTANGVTAQVAQVAKSTAAVVADPQLVMDTVNSTQWAYVIWEEEATAGGAMSIRTKKLTASTSFGTPVSNSCSAPKVCTITGIASGDNLTLTTGTPAIKLRANSNPVVRLDRSHHRIVMVWHDVDASSSTTHDVRLAAMSTDPNATLYDNWSNVLTVNQGGHSILPGVDIDSSTGNAFVSYYWFPANGSAYANYGMSVSFNTSGAPVFVANNAITSRWGDVQAYSVDAFGIRYLGDYHDVAYVNGHFLCAHILVVGTGNPWAFIVTP